ncbi:MAG TPA: DNA polymerase III subunit gamma/tau [Candidatus Eisenbacteria bacterium]|nr:DNA polymerase III subunit gamma/tau [Candidatus Eisenbacteria bacterium]
MALARKYRPQRFADLVGQDPVRLTLERAVASNRVAHAYLFAGPRGSGKTTTARLLAKALNCETRKSDEAEPCNECRTCAEITAGSSLDVLEIDGASNRGIEEIRNLRENVKYAPSGGKSKVYIIDEAHQLTDFAWNALLKTLEEPPPHVRFVFATTEPQDVPETIASRCQVFEFRRLRTEELVKHLQNVARAEKVPLEGEAAALIARAAEGSVRDALSRLDQALAVSLEGVTAASVAQALGLAGLEAYFDLGDALAAREARGALLTFDRLYDRGMDVEEVADGLTHHLRQLLLLAVDPSLEVMVDAAPGDRERYAAQARRLHATDLSAMLAMLIECRGQLRRAEAPRALFEVCLVDLCTLPTAGGIDTLLRRLESIEARLSGGSAGGKGAAGADSPRSSQAPAYETPRAERRAPPPVAPSTAPSSAPPSAAPPPGASGSAGQVAPPRATVKPVLGIVNSGEDLAAPSADAPKTEGPAPDGGDSDRWRFVVERVKERKLLLGTCLEEGHLIGVSGNALNLALSPEHSFHKAMLEMKENRELIQQELERGFARKLAFQCVVREAGPELSEQRARVDRSVREALAAGDAEDTSALGADASLVRRIVDLFDGEVVEAPPSKSDGGKSAPGGAAKREGTA